MKTRSGGLFAFADANISKKSVFKRPYKIIIAVKRKQQA